MLEAVLIVTSTILAKVQCSRQSGCQIAPVYQQAMIKSGIPYTTCVRIKVNGEADHCPTVQVHLGISYHTEAFCVRWNSEGREVKYKSPLKIQDTIECQCSVNQKCNGNFPAVLQKILGEALTPDDFKCIGASVTHEVMLQQKLGGQVLEATTTPTKRKTEKTSRTTKKTPAFLTKSSRTIATKSTPPKKKMSSSTTTKRASPTKPSTTERKAKETTILSSAAPEIERTTSLVLSSSNEHMLVTDASEDLTTIEFKGLVEAKEQENTLKERRRKISLHLLMLSLFLVTLSVSHLFCMCRLREKYLRSPPGKKGKSQSIIKSAGLSQSPLPGQASRQTSASSLRSGKGSQKSGKKTLGYFDV